MANYIYISYSQKDSLFVNKLSENLVRSGVNIWFDKMEINPGENWQKKNNEGISKASILLFISSKNSLKSKWINYEIKKFVEGNGRIISIIIDDYGRNELPDFLQNYQLVDFRNLFDLSFKELLSAFSIEDVYRPQNSLEPEIKSKGYVFLSYCEEDRTFVSGLKIFLKDNKYAYWDYEESNRDYHNHLFLELEDAIINAVATLSVLSMFWKQSKWTLKEYFFSEEVGTPVFLLKAKKIDPTLAIAGIPYIDFTLDTNYGFQKLSRELKRKNL